MNLKAIRDSVKSHKVSRKVVDALQEGDIYNDGKYEGKVVEIDSDSILIESQDENGDIVNVQIPIEDNIAEDTLDPTEEDLWEGVTDIDVIIAELEPITGFIENYQDNISETGIISIELEKEISEDDVKYLENRGYIFVDNEGSVGPGWVDVYVDPQPLI